MQASDQEEFVLGSSRTGFHHRCADRFSGSDGPYSRGPAVRHGLPRCRPGRCAEGFVVYGFMNLRDVGVGVQISMVVLDALGLPSRVDQLQQMQQQM